MSAFDYDRVRVEEAERLGTNWSCDQSIIGGAEMAGKIAELRQAKIVRNATSRSKGRRGNDAYRIREHLTEAEVDKLLGALKRNRHGHRDC